VGLLLPLEERMFQGKSKWMRINYRINASNSTFMHARDEEVISVAQALISGKNVYDGFSSEKLTKYLILRNQLKNLEECKTDNEEIVRLLKELHPHAKIEEKDGIYLVRNK